MIKQVKINKALAVKVLSVVDKGLCSGLGRAIPGKMCVEAAVCYAMGLPHGDSPPCVSAAVRSLKIRLNDSSWSSDTARAKGMRRLAIAQLGTADTLDDNEFAKRVVQLTISKIVPKALRDAAKLQKEQTHKDALKAAAVECERNPCRESALAAKKLAYVADAATYAAYAADAAADAANAATYAAYAAANAAANADADAARDERLSFFAEGVVQVLIEMKAPGTKYLNLTE